MKFWTFVLAIFLFALAAKPCVDGPIQNSHSGIEVGQQDSDHGHSSDLCSPFCSCACCGIQVVQQSNSISFEAVSVEDNFEKPSISYTSRLQSDYFGSIWQPPQLA